MTYTVTASADANGTVAPLIAVVNYDGSQEFTASPAMGYEVDKWQLDGSDIQTGGNTYTLSNITATHTVAVSFKIMTYTVTASADANGTVAPLIAVVNYDGSQEFTASPAMGYEVDKWQLDGSDIQTGGNTYTLSNITATHTVAVSFKIMTYTVSASADANGTVAPLIAVVNYDGSQEFTASPAMGYEVDKWALDGSDIQTGGNTYTLSNITATHTVYVTFKELAFAISGYVLEADGNTPVKGVLIQSDYNDINFVTDANGHYELWVNYGWSGVLKPQKDGYVFEPNSDTYANVIQNYIDVNYTASWMTFKISGFVLKSDIVTPINDVNVSAENGGGIWTSKYGGGSCLTDVNGYYEISVDYNWSGNVVPIKYAFAFEPSSRHYADVNEDYITGQDYNGLELTFRITGYVKNECETPIEAMWVSADNGGGSAVTDANGFYEVWVDYGWSGEVTPGRKHYTFEPNWISYVNVLADLANQNYVAFNIYDLDCDGAIGLGDLTLFVGDWLMTGPGFLGDFNADEFVNSIDFAEFSAVWQDK
jgi:hypothetical protein